MTERTEPPCRSLLELTGHSNATVGEVFRARSAATPDATLLQVDTERFSYASTLQLAERIARHVRRMLSTDRPRVAIYLEKRPEATWFWIGVQLAGGITVVIHRDLKGAMRQDQLGRARADLVVHDAEDLTVDGPFIHLPPAGAGLREAANHLDAEMSGAGPLPHISVSPADLASVVFTSGTTGQPKAAMVPHNQLCRGGGRVAEAFGLSASDVIHDWSTLAHIGGQLDILMATIIAGGALAIVPRFSARHFWADVAQHGSTFVAGFANLAHILLGADDGPPSSTLRLALIAGAQPELLDAFSRRFGAATVDAYGMTEAEPLALRSPSQHPATVGLGSANPDFEIAIVDDRGEAVPSGLVGRIVYRPRVPGVSSLGYEGADTLDLLNGEWFETRDYGLIDDLGHLHYHGRIAHTIRRRGENISAEDLERAVMALGGITACAAVPVPSPLGEDDIKIVVVPSPGAPFDAAELVDRLGTKVARFMLPRFVEVRAALPCSAVGKVQRDQLVGFSGALYDREAVSAHQRLTGAISC